MAKILIAEDDELMARMYATIFTFQKFDAVTAKDGEEAVAQALATKPDLIVLDVMMPKMDGFQVLDRLKADAATKHIPVIMLTNLASQQDAETALSKGAIKYLIKSDHEPKEITEIVTAALAEYKAKAA